MVGGLADEFQDQSGVDITHSENSASPINMTSNTAPSPYVASSTSDLSSNWYPWGAFSRGPDDLTSGVETAWYGGTSNNTAWAAFLRIDLGSAKPANAWSFRREGTVAHPISFTIEGSNDGSAWDVLDTVSGIAEVAENEKVSGTFDGGEVSYRYYQINITEWSQTNANAVRNMWFGTSVTGISTNASYEATGNTYAPTHAGGTYSSDLATGGAALSSGDFSGSYPASAAFDGSTAANEWVSGNNTAADQWIGYDLGSGNDAEIRRVRFFAGAASQLGDLSVDHSDDGSSWISAGTFPESGLAVTTWNDLDLPSSGSHRYWRVRNTTVVSDYFRCFEMELLSLLGGASGGMTLVSQPATAEAEPTTGRAVILADLGGADAIPASNTDVPTPTTATQLVNIAGDVYGSELANKIPNGATVSMLTIDQQGYGSTATVTPLIIRSTDGGSSWTYEAFGPAVDLTGQTGVIDLPLDANYAVPATGDHLFGVHTTATVPMGMGGSTGWYIPTGGPAPSAIGATATGWGSPANWKPTIGYKTFTAEVPAVPSAALNTDLLVDLSRDDGTTWEPGTLNDAGDYGPDVSILAAEGIDLSGQPPGTDVRIRIRTADAVPVTIHGWTLQWR